MIGPRSPSHSALPTVSVTDVLDAWGDLVTCEDFRALAVDGRR
jgi:hypothetical protein